MIEFLGYLGELGVFDPGYFGRIEYRRLYDFGEESLDVGGESGRIVRGDGKGITA
jgi:hypothetical protein